MLDRDSHSVRESDANPVKHIRRGGRGRADRKQTAERGCRLFSGGDGTDYQTDESGYDESGDSGYDNSDYSEEDGYYDEDGDFHYYE